MKWLRRAFFALLGLSLLGGLLLLSCSLLPASTAGLEPLPDKRSIARVERISLGGFEQTILMRGRDDEKPVLLYLHGGPGAAMLPLAPLYSEQLEEHFVMVHWDQRGAGSSCAGVDPASMTLDQIVADTIELSELLAKRRGTGGKIILLGHSWGSAVGVLAVHQRPGLFHAYIGLGQAVNGRRNEEVSYEWTVDEARRRGDEVALAELEKLTVPYESAEELGAQRRWLFAYNGSAYRVENLPAAIPAALFGREWTLADRLGLYDCFMASIGAMWESWDQIDFPSQIPSLEVPVFFFIGRHDWNTPFPLVEEWAETLQAPSLKLVWFEDAGHMIPIESPEAFEREVIANLVPIVESQ